MITRHRAVAAPCSIRTPNRRYLTALLVCGAVALGRPTATQARRGIRPDLARLCHDPAQRDPTRPGFINTAKFVAGRLARRGVAPGGEGRGGLDRYLLPFRWTQRWAPSVVSKTYDVVGVRRGRGKTRESVLVIAHLDGLTAAAKKTSADKHENGWSTKTLATAHYQGANDNASGVTAALYVSDAIGRLVRKRGRALKRDVIFLFPSAEEEGLRGTLAFLKYTKRLSGRKIVGVVNIDAVGVGQPKDVGLYGGNNREEEQQNPVYTRAMGLPTRGNMAGLVSGARLTGALLKPFRSSDQFATYQQGMPSVQYTTAVNRRTKRLQGEMHSLRDTFEMVNLDTLRGVARHALRLVVNLADDPAAALPGAPITNNPTFSHGVADHRVLPASF